LQVIKTGTYEELKTTDNGANTIDSGQPYRVTQSIMNLKVFMMTELNYKQIKIVND